MGCRLLQLEEGFGATLDTGFGYIIYYTQVIPGIWDGHICELIKLCESRYRGAEGVSFGHPWPFNYRACNDNAP